MLKQIEDVIINTDGVESIYFNEVYELLIRTKTGNEMYFYLPEVTEEDYCLEIISKLNELLQDPRVVFINLNDLIKD